MNRIGCSFAVILLLTCVSCEEDSATNEPVNSPPSDTLRVPGVYATIQAALDAAVDGKIVIVAEGVYRGPGNFDLRFNGKEIKLVSELGPSATILDCEGSADSLRVGFYFESNETSAAIVEGLTVRGGYNPNGAAVVMRSCEPTFINCIFEGNEAYASGGAIHCKSASPMFINCTFDRNSAPAGGAVFCIAGASPTFENCIVVFSTNGEAIYCSDVTCQPALICSNVYGNNGGDWLDCLEEQAAADGNMSADPMFCGGAGSDHHLQAQSPCLAGNNSCGELIGALGIGCADMNSAE